MTETRKKTAKPSAKKPAKATASKTVKKAAKKTAPRAASTKKAAAKPTVRKKTAAPRRTIKKPVMSTEEHWRLVAEAAYLRAERRGFVGGDPVDDWLAAEAEISTRLGQ